MLLGIGIRDLGLLLIFLFLMIVMAIARPIYGTSGVYMSVVAVHTLVRYLVWTTVIAIEFSYISRGCAVIEISVIKCHSNTETSITGCLISVTAK